MFAGPNGSGKSTITPSFQAEPDFPSNYINPDEIALSLGGNIMERAYEASAIAANYRDECVRNGESFAFETVMSHPSKLALLEKAKNAGFEITLVFISTKDPRYNVARVQDRVAKGGHDVPEDKIISRYHRTHTYLPIAISLANRAYIFDNTITPQLGVVLREGEIVEREEKSVEWISDALDNYFASSDERTLLNQRANKSLKACSISSLDESEYTGEIESLGKYYAIQNISNTEVILHHLSLFNFEIPLSDEVTIGYQNGVSSLKSIT
ncbi:MAG: zeta toxin family protein [Cyanobacteria bacterium J06607_15]